VIRRIFGCFVVAVIISGGIVGTLAYRKAYGTWWGTPDRIGYCGRTYGTDFSAVVSRAEIVSFKAALPGDPPYPVVTVARVPPIVGQPLLAARTPDSARLDSQGNSRLPCAMSVYLKIGPDSYNAYTISGGP
jgi:hypothetical protein